MWGVAGIYDRAKAGCAMVRSCRLRDLSDESGGPSAWCDAALPGGTGRSHSGLGPELGSAAAAAGGDCFLPLSAPKVPRWSRGQLPFLCAKAHGRPLS